MPKPQTPSDRTTPVVHHKRDVAQIERGHEALDVPNVILERVIESCGLSEAHSPNGRARRRDAHPKTPESDGDEERPRRIAVGIRTSLGGHSALRRRSAPAPAGPARKCDSNGYKRLKVAAIDRRCHCHFSLTIDREHDARGPLPIPKKRDTVPARHKSFFDRERQRHRQCGRADVPKRSEETYAEPARTPKPPLTQERMMRLPCLVRHHAVGAPGARSHRQTTPSLPPARSKAA